MCKKVICTTCQKFTWKGCGKHIGSTLQGVDESDRCYGWKKGICIPKPETRLETTNTTTTETTTETTSSQASSQDDDGTSANADGETKDEHHPTEDVLLQTWLHELECLEPTKEMIELYMQYYKKSCHRRCCYSYGCAKIACCCCNKRIERLGNKKYFFF